MYLYLIWSLTIQTHFTDTQPHSSEITISSEEKEAIESAEKKIQVKKSSPIYYDIEDLDYSVFEGAWDPEVDDPVQLQPLGRLQDPESGQKLQAIHLAKPSIWYKNYGKYHVMRVWDVHNLCFYFWTQTFQGQKSFYLRGKGTTPAMSSSNESLRCAQPVVTFGPKLFRGRNFLTSGQK